MENTPALKVPFRPTLRRALALTGVIVVFGGLALAFLGVGADVSRARTVTVVVRQAEIPLEMARAVKIGDVIYSDIAGAELGRVVSAKVSPMRRAVPDSAGLLHEDTDPTAYAVDYAIQGSGRVGDGLFVLQSQVVQVGRGILTVSKTYYFNPTVQSVNVR